MSVRYAVIFEQAERNWAAYVPDLPAASQPVAPWKRPNATSAKQSKAV